MTASVLDPLYYSIWNWSEREREREQVFQSDKHDQQRVVSVSETCDDRRFVTPRASSSLIVTQKTSFIETYTTTETEQRASFWRKASRRDDRTDDPRLGLGLCRSRRVDGVCKGEVTVARGRINGGAGERHPCMHPSVLEWKDKGVTCIEHNTHSVVCLCT